MRAKNRAARLTVNAEIVKLRRHYDSSGASAAIEEDVEGGVSVSISAATEEDAGGEVDGAGDVIALV